jgi:hypothetical protein
MGSDGGARGFSYFRSQITLDKNKNQEKDKNLPKMERSKPKTKKPTVEALTASRWSAPGFQEPTQERKPGDGVASLPAATLIFG